MTDRASMLPAWQGPLKADAIVVGSGFGGAVAACRLAQAGLDVLLLERGRRYEAADFPALPPSAALLPDSKRWTWQGDQGLWELLDLEELVSVQAAGYGGGSLIYANVHLRPPDSVFDGRWPELYQGGGALQEFFDLAGYMLEAQPVSAQPGFADSIVKADQLRQAAGALKRERAFFHPPVAVSFRAGDNPHGVEQGACTSCGRCCTGCPAKAKNTLDHNYLATAERNGARVLTRCEVLDFEERPTEPHRWAVECLDHLTGTSATLSCKYLFLCAGSLHTTRLLARARLGEAGRRAQALAGVGYFPGGDAVAVAYDTEHPQYPSEGPAITSALVHRDPEHPESFFMIQDGGYARELERLIGFLRAPAWLGRNRLSRAGSAATSVRRSERRGASSPPPEPSGALVSALDDVLSAVRGGDLRQIAGPQLKQALGAVLHELKAPLLLPNVVERTVRRAITERWRRFPLTRRLDPSRLPLRLLIALETRIIGGAYGGPEALADRVLEGLFDIDELDPPALARQLLGYDGERAEHRTMLLAMGKDAASGVLQYDPEQQRLIADLDLFQLAPGYSQQERLMTDVATALGGELRTNPAWAFLGKPITVHNQGGCRMSDRPEHGVTTPDGQVRGCPGLYVLDGSALATSVGVNPSATILAIAERNVLTFIRRELKLSGWPEQETTPGARQFAAQREGARLWAERARRERWQLSPPHVESVPIQTPALGLRFKEVMQGYYHPTETPPANDGEFRILETRGRPDYPLELELEVRAPNLATFFEDRRHELTVSGTVLVRLPHERAARSRAVTGRLELLVDVYKPYGIRSEDTLRREAQSHAAGSRYDTRAVRPSRGEQRFLQYSLSFKDGEQDWFLFGTKRVRDDPGFDLWRDTSALMVQLEQAVPASGSRAAPSGQRVVRGAGAIHVDLTAFLGRQLPSFEITGTDDPARIAWATAKFAGFFVSSLQRVYAPEIRTALETLFGVRGPGAYDPPAAAARWPRRDASGTEASR